MSEIQFRIFQNLLTTTAALVYAASLTAFMKPFLVDGTLQKNKKRDLFLVFFLHLAAWIICKNTASPRGAFGPVLIVSFLIASRALNIKKSFIFLLALLYYNARILSGLIVESADYILQRLFSANLTTLEDIYLYNAVQNILFTLSHVILLSLMLYTFRQRLQKSLIMIHWREICYLSLIPAAGILFGQMISVLLFEIENGMPLWLYEHHPLFLGIVPLLALLFYTGTYLAITFWQGLETLRREREDYFVNIQTTRELQSRLLETEHFYTHIRQMKHDIRGHLNNIRGLSKNGQYADLEKYINSMDDAVKDFDMTFQTGNAVTDVIVNDRLQQCLGYGIDFQVDFHYPITGQYDAFDLGIILNNLLQNALEACEKIKDEETCCEGKYITLTSRQKGNFYLIEVKNPFSGELKFKPDGLPETTKTTDNYFHGIGLSNVRREAEKYMGELELKTNHKQFCATILLQERSNQ